MPKQKEEKIKIIKVTSTTLYLVPMLDRERTKINGWDIDTVIDDWFKKYPLSHHHATRDGYQIGHSEIVIDTSVMNPGDVNQLKNREEDKN